MVATRTKTRKAAPVKERMINDETQVLTDAPRCFRQGDIYFVLIDRLPKSAKPRSDRQLAEGNTQGSRHVAVNGNVFDAKAADVVSAIIAKHGGEPIGEQYVGPILEGPALIEHPEHGDFDLGCEGVYAVVFQRSLDSEEREQRVQD